MANVAAWFGRTFGKAKPLVGVVHVAPLPGSPGCSKPIEHVLSAALLDAKRYLDAGFDGLIVENFGDAPFLRGAVAPHTVALLTRVALQIRDIAGARPVGVNVLRNDGAGAIGVALAAGLDFVRVNVLTGAAVTDQGIIEGDAGKLLRYRREIDSRARIFADFNVKHATHLREAPLEVAVAELVLRARADAVLVTGPATGTPPAADTLRAVKAAARKAPVLVASGVSAANIVDLAAVADGIIVGTAVKAGGRTDAPVQPTRARTLVKQLTRLSGQRNH